jgi:hypothetical protein
MVPVDPLVVEESFARMRSEQRLVAGFAAGSAAALVSAAIWAAITVATEYQIGWMAVGVGVLVGLAVRRAGRGVEPTFGVLGAALALVGCVLGNVLAGVGFISTQMDLPFFELLARLDFEVVRELLVATFSPMDLLFYGIAVFEGYRLSFSKLAAAAATTTPRGTASPT